MPVKRKKISKEIYKEESHKEKINKEKA